MTKEIEAHTGTRRNLGRVLGYPDDVLHDPRMTISEKRTLLAAWASDARAVQDLPGVRQLDNGAVVSLDEILDALRSLDHASREDLSGSAAPRRRIMFSRWRRRDDSNPPPCIANRIVLHEHLVI